MLIMEESECGWPAVGSGRGTVKRGEDDGGKEGVRAGRGWNNVSNDEEKSNGRNHDGEISINGMYEKNGDRRPTLRHFSRNLLFSNNTANRD